MANTKPSDLLNLPALAPAEFLNATNVPLDMPNAYLVVDVLKSTQDKFWVGTPQENEWFELPASRIATLKPVAFGREWNPRRILCEVVLKS